MNKDGFVKILCDKGYTSRNAEVIIDDVFQTICDVLATGESLKIRNFGTFSVTEAKPRETVNIRTGERILIPGHRVPKISFSNGLKKIVQEIGEAK